MCNSLLECPAQSSTTTKSSEYLNWTEHICLSSIERVLDCIVVGMCIINAWRLQLQQENYSLIIEEIAQISKYKNT